MKSLSIIIFVLIFCQISASSQPCLPDGITFTTQAQIDNFQTNHPNCTEIEGDVSIGESEDYDITNLDGLSVLTAIGGDLNIGYDYYNSGNPVLVSLTGLEGLTSIGGNLSIFGNYSLTSLAGLDNIEASSINNLYIGYNSSLSTCEVQSICDYLANPNGTVEIHHNASGCNNPLEVANACGFTMPCLPFGHYYFNSQADIDNFQSNYPGCTQLEGDVYISGNDIVNLNGLSVVISIGGSLSIIYNNGLNSLSGLDNLNSIGGNLSIYFNQALTSLTGLEGLTSVGGNLKIYKNDALTSFTGLEGLTSIEGNIYFNNRALTSLIALDNLTTIGGYLEIVGNNVLTSLSGLDNLSSIGGYLEIMHGIALTSLTGLDNLTSIGDDLTIRDNHALTSLTGLDNLTSIRGDLNIVSNDTLTSLTGLENIDANSIFNLFITDNSSLTTCEVQSICNYLANPNGTVDIHDNATGCNSPPEVANACGFTMPCLPFGPYYFLAQADIDNFQSNYPGCTQLEGNVYITGNDIVNLNGLSVVISIGGNLSIYLNQALTSLTGLEGLTSIGETLILIAMTP